MSDAPRSAPSWWLTRFVLLRLLGCVYAVAFLAAARQLVPLIGADGLTPLGPYLERVRDHFGGSFAGFAALPSLFWLDHSDFALQALAWSGFALSCVVAAGYANALGMAALWLLGELLPQRGLELDASPDALRAAFAYRGDVTLALDDGSALEGYVADASERALRVWSRDGGAERVVDAARVRRVALSGRDPVSPAR